MLKNNHSTHLGTRLYLLIVALTFLLTIVQFGGELLAKVATTSPPDKILSTPILAGIWFVLLAILAGLIVWNKYKVKDRENRRTGE